MSPEIVMFIVFFVVAILVVVHGLLASRRPAEPKSKASDALVQAGNGLRQTMQGLANLAEMKMNHRKKKKPKILVRAK